MQIVVYSRHDDAICATCEVSDELGLSDERFVETVGDMIDNNYGVDEEDIRVIIVPRDVRPMQIRRSYVAVEE